MSALVVVALGLSPAVARADDVSAKTLMRLANGPRSAVQEAASNELSSRASIRDAMASEATKTARNAYRAPYDGQRPAAEYMASGAKHDVAVEQLTRAAKLVNRTYAKREDVYQSHHLARVASYYTKAAEVARAGATQYHSAAQGYAPLSSELEATAKVAAARLDAKALHAEAKAAEAEQRAAAIRASRPQRE